jgi:hypothetical protein
MDNFQGFSHAGELRRPYRSAKAYAGLYPNRMDVLAQSGSDADVEGYCKK